MNQEDSGNPRIVTPKGEAPMTRRVSAAIRAAVCALAAPALAQRVPDYDFDWAVIGAPGNRPANSEEAPGWELRPLGSVGYEYRIAKKEVTCLQWLEFVEAYAPYWDGTPWDTGFTSNYIHPGDDGYAIEPGAEKYPANMEWRVAARYVNWLHNGKVAEQWAFENGVYDTSTFTENPDGSRNDQVAHFSDATFWLPTLDEWVKAVYYDPNRYGAGVEGYWKHPDSGDEPLVSGYPWAGGETNGGVEGLYGMDVGSYPDVQSPWGLLDASGGWWEWTGTTEDTYGRRRFIVGSRFADPGYDFWDELSNKRDSSPLALYGLRIASVIPCPPAGGVALGVFMLARKRRRSCECVANTSSRF